MPRSIPAQFSPFCIWIFYTYIFEYFVRRKQYFSCLHSLHNRSAIHNTYLPLPPPTPISFFSWNSQRRNIVNVISHLTILVGQAKRSHCFFPNLHNKNDWTRIFLDLWVEGGCFGWLNRIKRMKTQKAHLYTPFTFHAKFHTPLLRVKKAGNSQRTITEWESGVKHNLNNK